MQLPSAPPESTEPGSAGNPASYHLLYRYLCFGWLFADVGAAVGALDRRAALRYNRRMRSYLPTYLRRWSLLFLLAFGLGRLFEQWLATTLLAAGFYAGSCMAVAVMAVITVAWVFLSRDRLPWG